MSCGDVKGSEAKRSSKIDIFIVGAAFDPGHIPSNKVIIITPHHGVYMHDMLGKRPQIPTYHHRTLARDKRPTQKA
jgi:hypothetical protein